MITVNATKVHEDFHRDFALLLRKYTGRLRPIEILAIASNCVGKLIAMQDQRTCTPEIAFETVAQNIERGNRQMIEELEKAAGNVPNA